MLEIIRELCSKSAPSGNESAVRELIKEKIDLDKSCFYEDSVGNLIACHKGKKAKNSIAFFAGMDEPSITISHITQDGFLKFLPIGIPNEALFSKRFLLGENNVLGTVCGRTWHLSTEAQREIQPTHDELYIDIGALNEKDAENYISLGDNGVFPNDFTMLNPDLFCSKALESRICCASLISLLNSSLPYEFNCVFTACEMVGNLGSRAAANALSPDYGIIFIASPSNDTPMAIDNNFYSKLNDGVVIAISDKHVVYDKETINLTLSLAKKNGITHQVREKALDLKEPVGIISAQSGVKVCTLGVPARYMGTPSCTVSYNDVKNGIELAEKLVLELSV